MPSKSPDAFRTISEVADWLQTPAHVLRFWESKFSQVKPVKRAGGRRYYRPVDMALIGGIKKLLHDDGMTIKGVQKVLREQGIKYVSSLSPPLDEDLEALIAPEPMPDPMPDPTPAPPAPETGQVLDFTGGPGAASPDDAEAEVDAPSTTPAAAGDLFDETEALSSSTDTYDMPPPTEPTTSEPSEEQHANPASPTGTETIASDAQEVDLPDMPDTPEQDEGRGDIPEPHIAASVPQEAAPQSITPEEEATETAAHSEETDGSDAVGRLDPKPAPTQQDHAEDLPDFLQNSMSERLAGETAVQPDGTPSEVNTADTEPQGASVDSAASGASDPIRQQAAEAPSTTRLPEDPQDHDLGTPTGPLTLLTSAEMRGRRHSAERIETLIIRVRDHHRAMSQAARG